jgi:hypothetical protein
MISGATESSFRYLNLQTDLKINHDPNTNPDILWAHYSYDQPIYQTPKLHRIKHIVAVSDWLKQQFIKYLKVKPDRIKVIQNGGSDQFYYNSTPKTKTFVYTSTPFRGLEYLPEIWEKIIAEHPDAKLKVFSSMKLYGQDDPEHYKELYETINQLQNAQHYYPVEHKELAIHLRDAAFFLYPNTWEETSCVSLIEAMRSGCIPIISNIGALPETVHGFGKTISLQGINTTKGWIPDQEFISKFSDAAIESLDDFDACNPYYTEISTFAVNYYDWDKIRIEWHDYIKEIQMSDDKKEILPVAFKEAITDSYIDRTKEFAMKWAVQDRELCQTTSDFQIEKFIALNYNTISHAVENILRNRKAAALNLFNKSVEMTEKQREFDMKWNDKPKDQPIRWEDDKGNKKWIWYDLDVRQHEIYIVESENGIRDLCHQLATYDKILDKLEEKNGGMVTREQFNTESAENWKRKFQTNIFDDMLSRQTGVSQNVFDSFRKSMAPGLLDPNVHTIGFDAMPSFDKAISNPNEFMTAMSKGIEEKFNVFGEDNSSRVINKHEDAKQIEDWFNDDAAKK